MAITQAGTTLQIFENTDANTGTVSSSITVPADAEIVVVALSGFGGTNYFSTGVMKFTKGATQTDMTMVSGADSDGAHWQAAMGYLVLPDTGSSKTLSYDWAGSGISGDNTRNWTITFWKGVDTASPVRDSDGAQSTTFPVTTPTLTCVSGDLIVAFCGFYVGAADGSGTVDSWTNLTELGEIPHYNYAEGCWATGSPSGNTTVTAATTTSGGEPGICAVVLKVAAGGTTLDATTAGSYAGTYTSAIEKIVMPLFAAGGGFESVPPGYDIFVASGDSNKMYGASIDGGLDVSDSRIYALGLASPAADEAYTAVSLLGPSANDPIDYGGESQSGKIGHDVHFIKDYYIGNGLLQSGRNALIVPYARGGSSCSVDNSFNAGALTGSAGTPTAGSANMLSYLETRIATALALSGTNRIKAVLDHEGTNIYQAFGTTFTGTTFRYAWQYHRKIQYLRNLVGATVPIIICRLTEYAIDAGTTVYNVNGLNLDDVIRSMEGKFPYVAVANTQSPSALGPSDVHFTAAEQRTLASRYYTAYLAALANTTRTCTWDPYFYPKAGRGWAADAAFTLANGNLDASGDANSQWKTITATAPLRSGKAYCEVKVQAMASGTNLGYLGLCNADASLATYLGIAGSSGGDAGTAEKKAGQWGGVGSNDVIGWTKDWSGTASWTTNDIIQLAVDMTAGKAWIGKNNTWYNSGDPAAGTGQWISGIDDPVYIAASIYTGTGNTYRLQPTTASFTYSVPSGFSAWGT